jgi:hypothetical protein
MRAPRLTDLGSSSAAEPSWRTVNDMVDSPTKPDGVALYERYGFHSIGDIAMPAGAPARPRCGARLLPKPRRA